MAGSFGIGLVGTGAHFSTTGFEKEGTGDQETNSAKETVNAPYGSVFAEYTFGEGHGLTLGVTYTPMHTTIGSRTRSDTVSASEETSTDTGTYIAKARVSNHATIYLEPTLMYDNFGVYLKGGLARVTVNSLENIAIGTDSSAYGDETINGVMYGAGITKRFDNGMFYKLEAVRIDYDTVKMIATTGNKNTIEATPEQVAGNLSIGWRF